jgi:methylglyoxal synthase/pSer/pThr/pTyr-binding forkhead associated (FHA) protein
MKVKVTNLINKNESEELDLVVATAQTGEYIIGRSPDCDLTLDSPDVSRIHGKFFVQGGNYYYCDTGSRNGSLVNNKSAEKNQAYILKDGNEIQIGDYILKLEETKPAFENLDVTVVRSLDPVIVDKNINQSRLSSTESEVVNGPIPEVINSIQNQVTASELADVSSSEDQKVEAIPENQIIEEKTFVQPEDIINPISNLVTEEITTESEEDVDISSPILEEKTFIQASDIISQSSDLVGERIESDEDVDISSFILEETEKEKGSEPEEIASQSSDLVAERIESDEDVDISSPIEQEFTTVQPRDIKIQPPTNESDEGVDISSPIEQEFTTVQPRDIKIQPPTNQSEKVVDVDIDSDVDLNINNGEEEKTLPAKTIAEIVDSEELEANPFTREESEEITTPDIISSEELETQPGITEESDSSELFAENSAAVNETEAVEIDDNLETNTESKNNQMTNQKNIVLIAHESKKPELVELVAQHKEFLAQKLTITWPSVSEVLKEEVGLKVSEEIPAPTSGGYQKINSLLNSEEILAVIFLKDFISPPASKTNDETLLNRCNINEVLVATNVKTAAAIIHYLKNTTD